MSAAPDIVLVLRSEVPDPLMRSWPTVARDAANDLERKRAALMKAVEVIQTWHNAGVPEKQRSELWDLYWRNAPEMKLIREALS